MEETQIQARPKAEEIFAGLIDSSWPPMVESLFCDYCILGPTRTVKRLYTIALEKWPDFDFTISAQVLERYAWRYGWAGRVREYDRRAYMWIAEDVLIQNHEMNKRHAEIGMRALELAAKSLEKQARSGSLHPTAAVQLLKNAAEIERAANESELSQQTITSAPTITITLTTDNELPMLPGGVVDADD
jgi:hypothetical protein